MTDKDVFPCLDLFRLPGEAVRLFYTQPVCQLLSANTALVYLALSQNVIHHSAVMTTHLELENQENDKRTFRL